MRFFILSFLLSFNLFALESIVIEKASIKFPPPGMSVSAMFFKIKNNSDSDLKLVKVEGDFAKTFELHNMEMIDGKMKMRPVDFIQINKHSELELKHGSFHVMIFDIKSPLKIGDQKKIKLIFDNNKSQDVIATVGN
jgi:copper(I)-binding protein